MFLRQTCREIPKLSFSSLSQCEGKGTAPGGPGASMRGVLRDRLLSEGLPAITEQIMKKKIQSLGGQAVISKEPPTSCPRCAEPMQGRVYHSFLGHLGLHGLADKYFDGDVKAAQQRLRENGRARSDPFPGNGAWKPYRPIQVKVELGDEWMEVP
jgi:hypothetical protein